jgi:pimeloyl-ACP methyl ester carboxylesterase
VTEGDAVLNAEELALACNEDGEFRLAARRWNGAVRFHIGEEVVGLSLRDGVAKPWSVADLGVPTVVYSGGEEAWAALLSPRPPRFFNDLVPAEAAGGLVRSGDELAYWQYYPAIARLVEVLRAAAGRAPNAGRAGPAAGSRRFDSPVGRYVHLELEGVDHRIYFEEAGQGIPLLLQHTAGSHGVQYRHLFEMPEITDHFRLIAYDLPFHGKSVPPASEPWWTMQYRLTRDFAMAVPVALSVALELERPAFMGCSVGGLLALDLACFHPEEFRAVIALEPALKVPGATDGLLGFWHPAVGNESKARMMHALTAPDAPESLRRETVWAYSCGWPPAFIGDLHYYIDDHDLRDLAGSIDTSRCQVHMLSGEYDFSGTVELGKEAHQAIVGSTFQAMDGIGHFPMSEDPERLRDHLLPILEEIKSAR